MIDKKQEVGKLTGIIEAINAKLAEKLPEVLVLLQKAKRGGRVIIHINPSGDKVRIEYPPEFDEIG